MGKKGDKRQATAQKGSGDELPWLPAPLLEEGSVLRCVLTAHLLGIASGLGLALLLLSPDGAVWRWAPLGFFLVAFAALHQTEYALAVALALPEPAGALLPERDVDYTVGLLGCWLEYFVRGLWFPAWTPSLWLFVSGAGLMAAGHMARLAALCASVRCPSAPHLSPPSPGPSGIYRWVRHPMPAGFLWWGVGSQLILHNPVSLVAFTAAYWWRARRRVREAEAARHQASGSNEYAPPSRVWSGIPFVP